MYLKQLTSSADIQKHFRFAECIFESIVGNFLLYTMRHNEECYEKHSLYPSSTVLWKDQRLPKVHSREMKESLRH